MFPYPDPQESIPSPAHLTTLLGPGLLTHHWLPDSLGLKAGAVGGAEAKHASWESCAFPDSVQHCACALAYLPPLSRLSPELRLGFGQNAAPEAARSRGMRFQSRSDRGQQPPVQEPRGGLARYKHRHVGKAPLRMSAKLRLNAPTEDMISKKGL